MNLVSAVLKYLGRFKHVTFKVRLTNMKNKIDHADKNVFISKLTSLPPETF